MNVSALVGSLSFESTSTTGRFVNEKKPAQHELLLIRFRSRRTRNFDALAYTQVVGTDHGKAADEGVCLRYIHDQHGCDDGKRANRPSHGFFADQVKQIRHTIVLFLSQDDGCGIMDARAFTRSPCKNAIAFSPMLGARSFVFFLSRDSLGESCMAAARLTHRDLYRAAEEGTV